MLGMVYENVLCLKLFAYIFRNAEFILQISLHLLWLEMVIVSQLISSSICIMCKSGHWCDLKRYCQDKLKCIKEVPWADYTDCVFSNIRSNKNNNNHNFFFFWKLGVWVLEFWWVEHNNGILQQFCKFNLNIIAIFSNSMLFWCL